MGKYFFRVRHFVVYLVIVFSLVRCNSQNDKYLTANAKQLDISLKESYDEFSVNKYNYDIRNSILRSFRSQMRTVLSDLSTRHYSFEELAKSIKVLESKDKKLKLFSWDEYNGGTWHIYNSAYQYTGFDQLITGSLVLDDIDSYKKPFFFTDINYFELYQPDNDHYLALGYGTHGQGHEFYTMRLLSFVNGEIQDCKACFNGEDRLVLYKSRTVKGVIEYDDQSKTLKYPEQIEDQNMSVMKPSGNIITLKYKKGVFVKK